MITEKDRAKRILNEVTSYFFDLDLNGFSIDVFFDSEKLTIAIEANVPQEPESFQEFLNQLDSSKQGDIDEHFNSLLGSVGEFEEKEDYSLLGRTLDKAKGDFQEGTLFLEIMRKFK